MEFGHAVPGPNQARRVRAQANCPPTPVDRAAPRPCAPSETDAFEQIVTGLRTSPEWAFVDREVDIRLAHVDA
jgi:hypothetical protein